METDVRTREALMQLRDEMQGIERRLRVFEIVPDVKVRDTKNYTNLYCSRSVNKHVVGTWFHHADIVSNDAELYVSFWLPVAGYQVYSEPLEFLIGHRYVNGTGDVELEGWASMLTDYDIPQHMIDQVSNWFDSHPPIDFAPKDTPEPLSND